MRNKKWARLLAYATGSVNQELLLQNEYLAAENRILRAKLPARLRLNDPERATQAEIGKRVGRKALLEIASVARPDTILAWYRRLVALLAAANGVETFGPGTARYRTAHYAQRGWQNARRKERRESRLQSKVLFGRPLSTGTTIIFASAALKEQLFAITAPVRFLAFGNRNSPSTNRSS